MHSSKKAKRYYEKGVTRLDRYQASGLIASLYRELLFRVDFNAPEVSGTFVNDDGQEMKWTVIRKSKKFVISAMPELDTV